MKKILVASLLVCSFSLCGSFADKVFANEASAEPVQVRPARTQTMIPLDGPAPSEKSAVEKSKTGSKAVNSKKKATQSKKAKKVLPKKIVINYNEIDKKIENSDYQGADSMISVALKQNPKDTRAQILSVVSLAKKGSLDSAQTQVNNLSKLNPKSSDLRYAQGIIYYKKTQSSDMTNILNTPKLLQDALNEFKTAIQFDSKNVKAYNAAGVISLHLNQLSEAKDYFAKAYALDKNYSSVSDNLGTIDFMEAKYPEAQKKFAQALKLNPKNTSAMYHLAQSETINGNFSKALEYLNKAIAISPNSYAFYNLQGECFQNQGNQAAAINSYKKAISIKPEFVQPYLNLADIYEQRTDNEAALDYLKTALSIQPDFYDAKLKIADISLSGGKYDSAISYYNSLLSVDSHKQKALKGIANAYYAKAQIASTKAMIGSKKDLFEAFDNINKAIEANGSDLELHLAKLKLAKITGQNELSQNVLDEIIKSKGTDLTSKVIKGEAYLAMGDYANAKIALEEAISACKTLEDELYLAEIFSYSKQYQGAKKLLLDVLKKDPNNRVAKNELEYVVKNEKRANALFDSAQYYLKNKNYVAGVEYLSKSLALNPDNPSAYLILAQIYEGQKKHSEALENYKKFSSMTADEKMKKKVDKKIKQLSKYVQKI